VKVIMIDLFLKIFLLLHRSVSLAGLRSSLTFHTASGAEAVRTHSVLFVSLTAFFRAETNCGNSVLE
jgi:hypothetical protein